jgi:gamma-glutamylcyclotransferase (GGCT)/AIG2-like uncharacterized protein YtfP
MSLLDDNDLLFVYGTLRADTNTPMARLLNQQSQRIGQANMPGQIFDAGSFPAAVYDEDAQTMVHGSLHAIPNTNVFFQHLDPYEGYNHRSPAESLFVRRQVSTVYQENLVTSYAYLFNKSTENLTQINSGDYLAYLNDECS